MEEAWGGVCLGGVPRGVWLYLVGFHEKEVRSNGEVGGVWGHTEPDSKRNVAGILEGKLSAHQLASSAGERQGLCVRLCV